MCVCVCVCVCVLQYNRFVLTVIYCLICYCLTDKLLAFHARDSSTLATDRQTVLHLCIKQQITAIANLFLKSYIIIHVMFCNIRVVFNS